VKIRIRHYTFQLRDRYAAGHVVTAGEAQALNQQLAENIRNNIDRLVVDAIAGLQPGQLLSAAAQAELQERIALYELNYQFQARHIPRRTGPIEAEAMAIATERALEGARFRGEPEDGPAIDAEITAWLEDPEVQALARTRVGERERLATVGLEELL
jgi:hypothetical protein